MARIGRDMGCPRRLPNRDIPPLTWISQNGCFEEIVSKKGHLPGSVFLRVPLVCGVPREAKRNPKSRRNPHVLQSVPALRFYLTALFTELLVSSGWIFIRPAKKEKMSKQTCRITPRPPPFSSQPSERGPSRRLGERPWRCAVPSTRSGASDSSGVQPVDGADLAMGRNPNRNPCEHPNPTTEIGSNMGAEFTYPKNGIPLVLTHSYLAPAPPPKKEVESLMLWMEELLHPFKPMGNHCLFIIPWFLR